MMGKRIMMKDTVEYVQRLAKTDPHYISMLKGISENVKDVTPTHVILKQ